MKILLIDIDGLRSDVFSTALQGDRLPNIAPLLGGTGLRKGLQVPALAPAPSITFCSQASLFTGAHPSQHGIPGNQFFDRFGSRNQGVPRHYALDVGDTLAVDDAVLVFTEGLASKCLDVPTLYQRFADWDWRSVVGGHMYAEGAQAWIKPSLVDIARFTKGGNLFGLDAEEYDRRILEDVLRHLDDEGLPDVLTLYLMGLDHQSHHDGPAVQLDTLSKVIDPLVGELWEQVAAASPPGELPLVAIFSDHGQIEVVPDDRHSLRLAFPFEKEMGHLFDALGLDVHDFPGEDPNCDAVVASNGGLAHVYLQNKHGRWADAPEFQRDVIPVGKAFWKAHHSGAYAPEIQCALAGVLVRDVQESGWYAPYQALTPAGEVISLADWFGEVSKDQDGAQSLYADPLHRLDNLAGPFVGDLLLVSNYAQGFYFAAPVKGVHGGLHPEDSAATLVYGFPGASTAAADQMHTAVHSAIATRCQAEAGRQPSTADLLTGLLAVIENY